MGKSFDNLSYQNDEGDIQHSRSRGSTDSKTMTYRNTKSDTWLCCCAFYGGLVLGLLIFIAAGLCIYFLVLEPHLQFPTDEPVTPRESVKNSQWGYSEVRPGAHMFWWLYNSTSKAGPPDKQPLIIWVQGGPGESGAGIGNFVEIGPYDMHLRERKTSWVHYANILFTDQPVGTGFSYVDHNGLLANTTKQMADDLLTMLKQFFANNTHFQNVPVYLFGESYGGKVAPILAKAMHKEIERKTLKCRLVEMVLGGPAVKLVDTYSTYADFLHTFSLIDERTKRKVTEKMQLFIEAYDMGNMTNASILLGKAFAGVFPPKVDGYNVLTWDKRQKTYVTLRRLMNDHIKQILKVPHLAGVWKEASKDPYAAVSKDIIYPVDGEVEYILNNTNINVTVYNGQLDLVITSMGTEKWVHNLKWQNITEFLNAPRTPMMTTPDPVGYVRKYDKLSFYWILNSGHEVPTDNGFAAELMLLDIFKGDF